MTMTLRHVCLLLVMMVPGACTRAVGGTSNSVTTPSIVGRERRLEFAATTRGYGEFSVMILADGTPDLASLRLSGVMSTNKANVERWIAQTIFRPATQAGMPVAARYVWASDINYKSPRPPD